MSDYPLCLIYPLYTGALAIATSILLPRKHIRALFFWGMLYGGVADSLIILVVTHLFGIGGYKNYGPFAFMGIPFFPPLAWTNYFIIYLYLLPARKPYNYIFTVAAAGYCTLFSNILMNLAIFNWNYNRLLIPFFIYLLWNSLVTWSYQKYFAHAQNKTLDKDQVFGEDE